MKNAIWVIPAVLFTFAAAQTQPAQQTQRQAPAAQQSVQSVPPAQPLSQQQLYGRGRGGQPWAWNDRDKDGICDLTGRPVGQGRAIGGRGWGDRDGDRVCDFTGRPAGWRRGTAALSSGWGRGAGRGFGVRGRGCGGWWRPGYATPPTAVQPPASAAPVTPKQ
ncbi:MAG: hypothetical protein LC130_01265 [Bryobacterales bacterium]|nr:hypothetical protein [Bryobacterales bacterium]MEB2363874.1 hypothetical protein [Bryobacterales bacterium]